MSEVNYAVMIHQIDTFLVELGTSGIVDARKARDQLMDLRLLCMSMEADPILEIVPELVPEIVA